MTNPRLRPIRLLAATAILGAIIAPSTASADVLYAFSNTTGDAFSFTAPTYLTSITFAMGPGLLSCSGRFVFCGGSGAGVFFPNFSLISGPVDEVNARIQVQGFEVHAPWVFALGAFSANGTYTSSNNPVFNINLSQPAIELGVGTLTVSGSPAVAVTVPEPSSLPLALLALAGAGLLGQRRSKR